MNQIYTIGYANIPISNFIEILSKYKINCVIDVRSMPYSKTFKDYDKTNLKNVLSKNNIKYMSFSKEFGARREESISYSKIKYYDNENIEFVDFKKVIELDIFKTGFERVANGILKGFNICLLCSEKNPYDCHRYLMVGRYFEGKNIIVKNIVGDNVIEFNSFKDFFKDNFEKEKKKFLSLNKTLINSNRYSKDLFGNTIQDESFNYWYSFFNEYTLDKGIKLRSIQIAYKKGEQENE